MQHYDDTVRSSWLRIESAIDQLSNAQGTWFPIKRMKEDMERYYEPWRFYHGVLHIAFGLEELLVMKKLGMLQDWATAFLAWLYHDIIYATGSPLNERLSSEFLLRFTGSTHFSLRTYFLKAASYIPFTKDHLLDVDSHPHGNDIAILLDIDLAQLGYPYEVFIENGELIFQEWLAELSREQFKVGRKAFLTKFLERPFIYHTKYYRDKYEAKARENIARFIAEA